MNTITGNREWARARGYKLNSPLLSDMEKAAPFVNETGSDSSSLDNMLELLLAGGMDLFRAFRLLIPPAWQNHPDMDENLRAFYDFNSMHMEPWDGPAGIVMSDGRFAACGLDRNGLRPARYVVTRNRWITLASEVGIWDYTPDEVVEKGRVSQGADQALCAYRRDRENMPGSERGIPADAVILAFGFRSGSLPWLESLGVGTDGQTGRILAPDTGLFPLQTANEKVFAGGDTVRGADLVVTAIAQGRQAAESILAFLGV